MMKAKRGISILMAAMFALSAMSVSAFAESKERHTAVLGADYQNMRKTEEVDNGNGEWRYGTGIGFSGLKLVKTAYSDMDHNTREHRTSCQIDGNYNSSDWVPARTTSYSKTKGNNLDSIAYCNWDVRG